MITTLFIKPFFFSCRFSLYTSSAVNYSLFGKALISDMTVMPFIVRCAAVAAAITDTRRYHKFIGVFIFIMFLFVQTSDFTVIEYAST